MSIEKLNSKSQLHHEKMPFVQISNEVCEHIKDNDAFRLFCFLQSKSANWKIIKAYARKKCGVSLSHSKKCWSYLTRCGLLETRPVRDKKGRIDHHDVYILSGLNFKKDVPFLAEKTSCKNNKLNKKVHRSDFPPSGQTTPLENNPLLNKDITKQSNISVSSSSYVLKKRESALSKNFTPNKEHERIAKEHGIDIHKEMQSFKERHKGKKTDYEFQRWLENAIEYKNKSSFKQKNNSAPSKLYRDFTGGYFNGIEKEGY